MGGKEVYTFPQGYLYQSERNSVRLEFEPAHNNIAVQQVIHNATQTLSLNKVFGSKFPEGYRL